ncbi:hypothetical protein D3C73_1453420 [compost metagenome]
MVSRNIGAILSPQEVFKQYLKAERKAVCALYGVQPENFIVGAGYIQYAFGTEAVHSAHGRTPLATVSSLSRGWPLAS